MRAKAGVTIVSCSALSLALCAGQIVLAQAAPTTPSSAGATFEDSTNELAVAVGKAVLVDTAQPIQRVAIGLGDIAEATAVSPTEVMVEGKAPGETSLIIWDIRGGRQFFNVTVRPIAADIERKSRFCPSRTEDGVAGPIDQGELQQQQHFSARHGQRFDQFDSCSGDCVDGRKSGEPAGRDDTQVDSADPAEGSHCERGSQQGACAGH